uniref:Ig-like domain-containing protein n=1 Tax=Anolis carolinensis TaxID=28377 RepID=A0A803SYK0_ANOCA
MGYPLEILVFGLLSTGPLWAGVQCDINLYKLYVQPATVQEGLCVFIPCNFTYDPNDASSTATLYGYWFKGGCFNSPPLVATNKPGETIAENAQNRFILSEEVEQGNCSLVINDVQNNDDGDYCFRMEKEPKAKWSFKEILKVTVKELEDPVIHFSRNLQANHHVNITCIVPRSCYLKPPRISCKTMAGNFTLRASEEQSSDSHVHSVFDFTPSVADNKQNLTCAVTYGNTSIYKETTVLLNVKYPPQTPVISSELRRPNKSSENETDVSQIIVEKGDTVILYCKAVGNPSANVTWLNRTNNIIGDNELVFSKVTAQDEGDYTCLANNSEGTNNKTFRLLLKSSDKPTSALFAVMGALSVIVVVILIIAVILIFKKYQRKSMIDMESHKTLQTPRSDSSPNDQISQQMVLCTSG